MLLLHGNLANSIKLSEMTVNIARLMKNITFHFLWLVLVGSFVSYVKYPCNEHNVNVGKNSNNIVDHALIWNLPLRVVQVASGQQNDSKFTQYSNIHY